MNPWPKGNIRELHPLALKHLGILEPIISHGKLSVGVSLYIYIVEIGNEQRVLSVILPTRTDEPVAQREPKGIPSISFENLGIENHITWKIVSFLRTNNRFHCHFIQG